MARRSVFQEKGHCLRAFGTTFRSWFPRLRFVCPELGVFLGRVLSTFDSVRFPVACQKGYSQGVGGNKQIGQSGGLHGNVGHGWDPWWSIRRRGCIRSLGCGTRGLGGGSNYLWVGHRVRSGFLGHRLAYSGNPSHSSETFSSKSLGKALS